MSTLPTVESRAHAQLHPTIPPIRTRSVVRLADEDGSLVAEYGLLALVAATLAGLVIAWAKGGAVAELFDMVISSARGLVGG